MLVSETYCQRHKPKRTDSRSEAAAEWHKLYSLKIWTDRLRPEQLIREPFCRECARHGVRTYATDVDHVVPHEGRMDLFTDPANLQSLCHRCHSAKTAEESRRKAAGKAPRF